jgi:phage terminase large subunit-like protein
MIAEKEISDEISELKPVLGKRESRFAEIVSSLQAGKVYVMREGYSKNALYTLMRKLNANGVNVKFGIAGKNQYALLAKKDS